MINTLFHLEIDGYHMMGLDNEALIYLVEQLPGAEKCKYYDFIFHKPTQDDKEVSLMNFNLIHV